MVDNARRKIAVAIGALALLVIVATPAGAWTSQPPGRSGDHAPAYYVALGDSLAAGQQPGPDGSRTFTGGYTGRLYDRLLKSTRTLRLVNLACSGETTDTLIAGGVCTYDDQPSQLAAAAEFLHAHRKFVRLVTIDIGANDVLRCLGGGAVNAPCLATNIQRIATNLPRILATLRAAAPQVRIVGMNYYDPFLAAWLLGPGGKAFASASLVGIGVLNATLETAYAARGADVADVETAFSTFARKPLVTLEPFGKVPLNVARICQWTWMCVAPPRGPDVHPNDLGYAVIAKAFVAALAGRA